MSQRHGHGIHSIDRQAYRSGMRDWNAGFKTALSIGTLILCLAADHAAVSVCVILSFAVLQTVKGKLSLGDYLALLCVPLAFVLLGGIAVACDLSAIPAGEWNVPLPGGYLCASTESVWTAFRLILKVLGAVSAMYLLALTTTAAELVNVLHHAHLPSLLCTLMYLIYRFVFVLLDQYGRMRDAAGARLGWRDFRASCRSFGGAAGNLLVMALRRARVYDDAMAARGHDGTLRFLEEKKTVHGSQIVCMLLFWAVLLALAWI